MLGDRPLRSDGTPYVIGELRIFQSTNGVLTWLELKPVGYLIVILPYRKRRSKAIKTKLQKEHGMQEARTWGSSTE